MRYMREPAWLLPRVRQRSMPLISGIIQSEITIWGVCSSAIASPSELELAVITSKFWRFK